MPCIIKAGSPLLAALILPFTWGSLHGQVPAKLPAVSRNEQLTSEAWLALEKRNPKGAIEKADKCIEQFEASALKLQEEIQKAGKRVPVGAVNDEQKKAVHQNGLLNDVATCFFIKAKALEELKDKAAASAAYKNAVRFTHARTWDPQGWFWSPSEASAERLAELK